MSYADEMGQREVIIDRGAMGFGFTLRRPATPNRGGDGFNGDEPTYVYGAPVRSVEEKGPACRGGLDKDEVVTAVNDTEVHGKSFLEVMRIIQASRRVCLSELARLISLLGPRVCPLDFGVRV